MSSEFEVPATPFSIPVRNGVLERVPGNMVGNRCWCVHLGTDTRLGPGDAGFSVAGLGIFSPIEFGKAVLKADGSMDVRRWYGVVRLKYTDTVVFEQQPSAEAALRRARDLSSSKP